MDATEVRYAPTPDGAQIAYQIIGDGSFSLLSLGYGNLISFVDRDEEPHVRSFERRLASFSRLIRFDPRGLGLSDPLAPGLLPSVELQANDAMAVLDAVGCSTAALFATGNSGMAAIAAAAAYPQRVAALALVHCYARLARAPDYPFGFPERLINRFTTTVVDTVDTTTPTAMDDVTFMAPSLGGDADYRKWWARAGQRGASPTLARTMLSVWLAEDVRALLPAVHARTLVVQRMGNRLVRVEHAEYLADQMSDARLVQLPGDDHLPYAGDRDAIADEIEEFLTGARRARDPVRVLSTIVFSDIVGSTERVVEMGDRHWRELLDTHDEVMQSLVTRFGGRTIKSTGDGFVAVFDGPARAVKCGHAMQAAARNLALLLRIGIHTGEVEQRGQDIGGIAVHTASRVQARAAPGEVLVSRTVVDLVAGSGLVFEARGEHSLKGVPGTWQLFRAQPS